LRKPFVCDASIIHMGKVPQQTVIVMTAALTVIMWISTLAMVIPQAAYAQQNEVNPPLSSSSSSVDGCASDELPASINGRIQCMRQGECYSEQFEGKEVKHCNFMMSDGSDE
jgi:hypothetical protein